MSEMLCRQLDWTPEQRLPVVAAALTMNISMLALQDRLYNQGTPLDDAQPVAVREHPAQAVAQLEQLGVTDVDRLSAIAQHHEALDGSGYPPP
jgi:HD-GYP domain-containing protein (c-di-GMP phosphodiesterase class II)